MITAEEARTLAVQSSTAINLMVERVCEKIQTAAKQGERSIRLDCALPYDKELAVEWSSSYKKPDYTPMQFSVAQQLKSLGFVVNIQSTDVIVGGGLGITNIELTTALEHFIEVKW